MISSVTLPKVALRSPPTMGPDRSASWSVARPIRAASGTIATQDATKTRTGCSSTNWATREIGTKTSSQ